MARLGVPGKTNARQHTELSALNEISRKLDRLKQLSGGGGTPIVGFSTEAKQDDIITELQSIVAKQDFEIVESIGVDSSILTAVTLGTVISDSLGIGGGTPPSVTPISQSGFSYLESNRNYEVIAPVIGGFPSTGLVELYIEFESITPNPGNDGGTLLLYDPTSTSLLDSATTTPFNTISGNSQLIQLTFDNTSTNYTNLNLIIRSSLSTTGYPANYRITVLGSTPNGFGTSDLIVRRDRYENNVLVSTTYVDAADQPYTLIGTFLRDNNRSTEERLADILVQINNKVSTSNNQQLQLNEAEKTNSFLQNDEAVIVLFNDIESGSIPTFPFNVTDLGVNFSTGTNVVTIPSTTVNNMAELVILWNTNVSAVEMIEVDQTTFKLAAGSSNLPFRPFDSIVLNEGFTFRIWRAANFIPSIKNELNASSTDKIVEQLRRTYLFDQYSNWEFIKGTEKTLSYYPASTPGTNPANPSGSSDNIQTISFTIGTLTYLLQTLEYNTSNNVTKITTT